MHVCMHICMHVLHLCIFVRMNVCMFVRMYVCMYIMYVTQTHTHTHTHAHTHVYVNAYVYVCLYIHVIGQIHQPRRGRPVGPHEGGPRERGDRRGSGGGTEALSRPAGDHVGNRHCERVSRLPLHRTTGRPLLLSSRALLPYE